jgi:putative ATP-dependent endonuclease of OLD family
MYISSLKIKNFRNFKSANMVFNKGVNTVLGENGSGKTNALFALRLLLDSSLPRNITKLKGSDFCRSIENWRGHWIIISIDFDELSAEEGCQILKHNTGHMDTSDSGTLTYFFRPCFRVRQDLHSANNDLGKVEAIIKKIKIDDYETIFTGRSEINFIDDDNYKELVGDFENGVFPDPNEKDLKSYGIKVSPLHEEVSFTFVKALRDVVSDLNSYRNSPLLHILKDLESDISDEDKEQITGLVDSLNTNISNLDEIKQVSKGIQNTLHNTVGHTFSPIIDIESSLPGEMGKLLQKLSLTVGDSNVDGFSGDVSELSLGGANLIYLALKLLEYEKKQASDKAAQFLVIEEPEAHIHNHIQKTLFENHSTDKTQVFLSTHSTHISSAADISEMNILGISGNTVDVYQPSKGLDPLECSRIERYLNATRSTLLFAKGVILVEGDAELIVIPALVKAVFGVSLDELGISLISMDCAFFEHLSKLFNEDRIRKNCAIITDSDLAFVDLPDDKEDDSEYERSCRNSQESGIQRKTKLDKFVNGNKYISAFYAQHTFEVDFIQQDNSIEAVETLKSIYSRKSNIEKSKERLESSDNGVAEKEMLRLAEKAGKGWFSLLLSETVCSETYIPKYIIEAISFSCQGILNESILMKMCQYRLNNPMGLVKDDDKPIKFFKKNSLEKTKCINKFIEDCVDDDLTYFINFLGR